MDKLDTHLLILMDWIPPDNWILAYKFRECFSNITIQAYSAPHSFNSIFEKIRHVWTGYVLHTFKAFIMLRDIEVVFAWQAVMGLLYAFFARLFCRKKTRIVIGHFIIPKRTNLINWYLRYHFIKFCLNRVDMIIVSSKIEVELFRHEFNNRRTRFEFIPVCVDLKESYKSVDENFIFSGGRSNRDYKTLFQALDKIDMPVKIIAQQFNVSGLTIPQNVEFIDGSSEDEFSRMMCRSSFVVIPLERSNESSGHLVLLRAWSFGKAVIITENAGIQDYVKHGVNSIIIDHKDINGLHKAIKRLISDQDLRITLGKNGKEDVMNHFTEKAYSESLRALIFKFLIKSDRARLTSI